MKIENLKRFLESAKEINVGASFDAKQVKYLYEYISTLIKVNEVLFVDGIGHCKEHKNNENPWCDQCILFNLLEEIF